MFIDSEELYTNEEILPVCNNPEMIPQELNLHWKEIRDMDDNIFYNFVEKLRNVLKTTFVKFNPLSDEKLQGKFKKFFNTNYDNIYFNEKDKSDNSEVHILKCLSVLQNGINYWFPEKLDVPIRKGLSKKNFGYTVKSQFDDENKEWFHKKIRKTIKEDSMYHYTKCVDGKIIEREGLKDDRLKKCLRQIINIGGGLHGQGNFSPCIAKYIYSTYLREFKQQEEIIVYDPCMGWGGRLCGLLGAQNEFGNTRFSLFGTDVNSLTNDRFYKFEQYWKKYINNNNFDLYKFDTPQEEMNTEARFRQYYGRGHLVFTSPPYFNREIYSDDYNQSAHMYPSPEKWTKGFLEPMLENQYNFLRPGGYLIINIKNLYRNDKLLQSLQDDTVRYLESKNMKFVRKYNMILNYMIGNKYNFKEINDSQKFKIEKSNLIYHNGKYNRSEPIFVFQK